MLGEPERELLVEAVEPADVRQDDDADASRLVRRRGEGREAVPVLRVEHEHVVRDRSAGDRRNGWQRVELEAHPVATIPASRGDTLRRVQNALLAWFERNGRDLPWRGTRDPYAILVSEVMLQQTQVERVVPRWHAWLERWPTIDALAEASPAEVIREWQGLGYNRRAINLHRAARVVVERGWPDDLTELPGVGRYTADAVARFAHEQPVLPVDVNVARVQARTGARFAPAAAAALMDLGATVCLARVPRCGACPLSAACPSRGRRFEPERKQSRFEGSFRQRRARALRAVAAGAVPLDRLDVEAVEALAHDGLVHIAGGTASLPA